MRSLLNFILPSELRAKESLSSIYFLYNLQNLNCVSLGHECFSVLWSYQYKRFHTVIQHQAYRIQSSHQNYQLISYSRWLLSVLHGYFRNHVTIYSTLYECVHLLIALVFLLVVHSHHHQQDVHPRHRCHFGEGNHKHARNRQMNHTIIR